MNKGYAAQKVHAFLEGVAEIHNGILSCTMSKEMTVRLSSVWQEECSPEEVTELETEAESEVESIIMEESLLVSWRDYDDAENPETVVQWGDNLPIHLTYRPDHIEIWKYSSPSSPLDLERCIPWDAPSLYIKVLSAIRPDDL